MGAQTEEAAVPPKKQRQARPGPRILLEIVAGVAVIAALAGIGKLIFDMVMTRNFPVVQGAVLVTIALYVFVTLFADLMVAWIDPRVRESL